jgi:hypothetical protein
MDLIYTSKYLIYLQGHSIDPGGSSPPSDGDSVRFSRLGLEHEPSARSTRAHGFWLLVDRPFSSFLW